MTTTPPPPSSQLPLHYYPIQLDSDSDSDSDSEGREREREREQGKREREGKRERGGFEECFLALDEEYSIVQKDTKKREEKEDYNTAYLKLREMEKKIQRELHYLKMISGVEMRLCPLCIKETFSVPLPPTPLKSHVPLLLADYPNLYCTKHGASLGDHLLSK